MNSTVWRKPVGDCGGISYLIAKYYLDKYHFDSEYYIDVVVHGYREVGTSLEASLEVRFWDYNASSNNDVQIKFENITI